MVRSKFSVMVALVYAFAIACALLCPRTLGDSASVENLLIRVVRGILFISGPLEVIGNFFLFVPVFLALVHAAPDIRVRCVALICCLGSASVEVAQSWIPGRVSSVRDFLSNALGVFTCLIAIRINPQVAHWVRGK